MLRSTARELNVDRMNKSIMFNQPHVGNHYLTCFPGWRSPLPSLKWTVSTLLVPFGISFLWFSVLSFSVLFQQPVSRAQPQGITLDWEPHHLATQWADSIPQMGLSRASESWMQGWVYAMLQDQAAAPHCRTYSSWMPSLHQLPFQLIVGALPL